MYYSKEKRYINIIVFSNRVQLTIYDLCCSVQPCQSEQGQIYLDSGRFKFKYLTTLQLDSYRRNAHFNVSYKLILANEWYVMLTRHLKRTLQNPKRKYLCACRYCGSTTICKRHYRVKFHAVICTWFTAHYQDRQTFLQDFLIIRQPWRNVSLLLHVFKSSPGVVTHQYLIFRYDIRYETLDLCTARHTIYEHGMETWNYKRSYSHVWPIDN